MAARDRRRPPSRRLEAEAIAYFEKDLKAERVVATSYIGGEAYAPHGSWNLAATSLDKIRQLLRVDLAEGEFPAEGEVLAPASMRPSVRVGDGITFVFKNSDLIIDSIRLRVSGFFSTSHTGDLLLVTQSQFFRLDESRVCDRYYVFLPGSMGKHPFLRADECKRVHSSFANSSPGCRATTDA